MDTPAHARTPHPTPHPSLVVVDVMRRSLLVLCLPVCLAVVLGLLSVTPSPESTVESVRRAWQQFRDRHPAVVQSPASSVSPLSVMSFNIRLDGVEADPANHWTQRMARVRSVLDEYRPASVGLQEPFGGQVWHLQSVLDPKWRTVGGHQESEYDLGHPSRHRDMQTGILYDSDQLELLHSHYHWLSRTPDVPGTKDWRSMGVRTLLVAHFKRKVDTAGSTDVGADDDDVEVLHFNTHLDVASEEARREQAKIVRRYLGEYAARYPKALVFLTGDFNTAVGQAAYRILTEEAPMETGDAEENERTMVDAWTSCADRAATDAATTAASSSSPACTVVTSSPSMSFHGWLGLRSNSYLARLVARAAFVLHGMGFTLPHSVPTDLRACVRAILGMTRTGWRYSIREAIPTSFERMHVDWILYARQAAQPAPAAAAPPAGEDAAADSDSAAVRPSVHGGSRRSSRIGRRYTAVPLFVSLVDVRNSEFSSDHYPLLAVFDIVADDAPAAPAAAADE